MKWLIIPILTLTLLLSSSPPAFSLTADPPGSTEVKAEVGGSPSPSPSVTPGASEIPSPSPSMSPTPRPSVFPSPTVSPSPKPGLLRRIILLIPSPAEIIKFIRGNIDFFWGSIFGAEIIILLALIIVLRRKH